VPGAARRGLALGELAPLGYGELADAAATLPVPARDSVPLKQLKDFTLIGTPAKRLDTPDKVERPGGIRQSIRGWRG